MKPRMADGVTNTSWSWRFGRTSGLLSGFALVLICFWAALQAGCSKEKTVEPSVPVQVTPVEKTTVQQIVSAEAILFPLQQSALVPKISAPVKTFYVKRGGRVRKGQLLAVLENRDLSAAAEENKGSYEQAQAAYTTTTAASLPEELQKATADVDSASKALEAQQKVYVSREELFKQGALPRKELDQSAVDLTNARNTYELARRHLDALQAVGKEQTLKSAAGQLQSAEGKYHGSEAQLSYSEIRSPIDGVITDRPLYPGEMAAAGTPLLTVMDTSQIIAKAHIPQEQAQLLKVGDRATLTVPGEVKPVEGKVTIVSPALDPNSTTVEVWVQVKNPEQRLKPGSNVQVSMVAQVVPDALVVPGSALLTASDGATTVLLVGSDGRAHQQAVKTGIKQGDEVQVVEGLKEGQQVVASGAYGLPDNTKITVEAPKESAKQTDKKPTKGRENDSEK
jgi:HlyD family secretion protein